MYYFRDGYPFELVTFSIVTMSAKEWKEETGYLNALKDVFVATSSDELYNTSLQEGLKATVKFIDVNKLIAQTTKSSYLGYALNYIDLIRNFDNSDYIDSKI